MIVSLIGYRGTGKSTVARLLAAHLGWMPMDADDELERLAGKTIKSIFAEEGETAFRDWESRVVAELVCRDRTVVSWGGGAVLREENRRAIEQAGPVVWLSAEPAVVHHRISADSTTAERRPNLTARGGYEEIEAVLRERTPIYQQCADWQVDTGEITPEQVAEAIAAWLKARPGDESGPAGREREGA